MKRIELITDEIYHIYNRGVDKREIFLTTEEYSYFVHLLYVLNKNKTSDNIRRDYLNKNKLTYEGGSTSLISKRDDYDCSLVEILAFVLMPNHYHLLIRQKNDGGISKFMQRLGTGYTMLFNKKHERSGSLFQGKFKSVHIANDAQLLYIPHYIHLNPLSLHTDTNIDTFTFLMNYKWSSLPDYLGTKNFPSVTNRNYVLSLFGNIEKYKKNLANFIPNNNKFLSELNQSDLIDYDDEGGRTSLILNNV